MRTADFVAGTEGGLFSQLDRVWPSVLALLC
jgi:hypothetical protein